MADRYLLESGAPDGYLLEDGSGVLLLEELPSSSTNFVNNCGAPQIANYVLVAGLGFFAAAIPGVPSTANSAEYMFGTHAQAVHSAERAKTQVWRSAASAVVAVPNAVPAFIRAPQQAYNDIGQTPVFQAAIAGAKPEPAQFVRGGGETPATAYAQVWRAAYPAIAVTSVPQFSYASTQGYDNIQPRVWPSQPAQIVVETQIGAFVWASGQGADSNTSRIFPAQREGQTPPRIVSLLGGPQFVDLTQQGFITQPTVEPPLVSYAMRTAYAAPQAADLTQQGLIFPAVTQAQGSVPPLLVAGQEDPTQRQPLFTPAAFTAPIVTGEVPPFVRAGMPQESTYQIPAFVVSPLVFGEPPAPPADVGAAGGGDDRPRARQHRGFDLEEWKKARKLDDDIEQTIRRVWAEIKGEAPAPVFEEAAMVVLQATPKTIRARREVDWPAFTAEWENVYRLMQVYDDWQREEDDIEFLLLNG